MTAGSKAPEKFIAVGKRWEGNYNSPSKTQMMAGLRASVLSKSGSAFGIRAIINVGGFWCAGSRLGRAGNWPPGTMIVFGCKEKLEHGSRREVDAPGPYLIGRCDRFREFTHLRTVDFPTRPSLAIGPPTHRRLELAKLSFMAGRRVRSCRPESKSSRDRDTMKPFGNERALYLWANSKASIESEVVENGGQN